MEKEKIERLIEGVKEVAKMLDGNTLDIAIYGVTEVHVFKMSEFNSMAEICGAEVDEEIRDSGDYPYRYSFDVDGIKFFTLSGEARNAKDETAGQHC